MMQATSVVKNKFWIVEKDGKKVATIQSTLNNKVVYVDRRGRKEFPSIKTLGDSQNIVFVTKKTQKQKSNLEINGYPCSHPPFNALIDVRKRIPRFTVNEKSRSYYCAGYYAIFDNGKWDISFCPKKIVLDRCEFNGPFKTNDEAEASIPLPQNHETSI